MKNVCRKHHKGIALGLPDIRAVSSFLSNYAVLLFGSGATCIRLEKNMTRMAKAFGMEVEFSVLPRHLHITVSDGKESLTSVVAIKEYPISFAKIASLSKLSWQISDRRVSFDCAVEALRVITHERTINRWELLILVSLANASFCRLFNGDLMAMAVVFIATLVGFRIKQTLASRHFDFRITVFVCALVSSVIAAAGGMLSLGATPQIAVATSVLYLVPGIPFINSVCDLIGRHYLCATGRMMNTVIILFCMSAGLCLGMFLMHKEMF